MFYFISLNLLIIGSSFASPLHTFTMPIIDKASANNPTHDDTKAINPIKSQNIPPIILNPAEHITSIKNRFNHCFA